jgi:hypothetical protein
MRTKKNKKWKKLFGNYERFVSCVQHIKHRDNAGKRHAGVCRLQIKNKIKKLV